MDTVNNNILAQVLAIKTPGRQHEDGTESLPFTVDDGGRNAAGYKGTARDCVARSIAIASGEPYADVYKALSKGMGSQRGSKGATARNGVATKRAWFKRYMRSLGFTWTPTMRVGSGCKVSLIKGHLPPGRLVVAVSKHYTAVIDGVIRDTGNPSRTLRWHLPDGSMRISHRCVYGYWTFQGKAA